MRQSLVAVLFALVAACTQGGQNNAPSTPPANEPPTGAPAPTAQPEVKEQSAYLLYTAALLKQPSDDKKVKNPSTGKDESNWMASLYRGEEVTLLKQDGDWSQVRASDGKEGWMKSSSILSSEGVTVATVFDEAKTFSRPDFLAPSKTVIAPGSLLYVIKKSKDDTFSEINYAGSSSVWVETGKLNSDGREVSAARVVSRARSLDERKDEQAKQYWELAKSQFGDTQVVQKTSAVPAAPAPAPDAAPAPAPAGGGN